MLEGIKNNIEKLIALYENEKSRRETLEKEHRAELTTNPVSDGLKIWNIRLTIYVLRKLSWRRPEATAAQKRR